jgi:CHAP domain
VLFANRDVQLGHVPSSGFTASTVLRRSLAVVVAGTALGVAAAPTAVHAATSIPWGTVLISGSQWAGADAALGDLNVYSNGSGSTDQAGLFGPKYECTELAQRWAHYKFGEPSTWPISKAADMWSAGPTLPLPLTQNPNGGARAPQFGDIMVFAATSANPTGHVAVVSSVTATSVTSVQENLTVNGTPTGQWTQSLSGTTVASLGGDPVLGWLRASGPVYVPNPNVPGGQVLDSWGGVHPFGSAYQATGYSSWPGWNIARDIVTVAGNPDTGYVLDGWGGVHPFGGAPQVIVTAYWSGWDIARQLVLRADGHSGYVLDGWGGVHPFGVAGDIPPGVSVSGYWSGWDIARGLVLRSDGVSGYVMDGWGGLHPFGQSLASVPNLYGAPYWYGWDIARGVVLSSDSGGYMLDGWGGVHAFGTATAASVSTYTAGADNARGVRLSTAGGGYVVFQSGALAPFGTAPTVNVGPMALPLAQAIG